MSRRAISFPVDDRWLPKSVLCLRSYNLNKFVHDVIAGITVGLVALPLAMAFSIASGLTPQAGIYCAIVTGFLISALGGSKTQIGGPTGAFVVVVARGTARKLHRCDNDFVPGNLGQNSRAHCCNARHDTRRLRS
jgi:MFS superfamily sulfate permease-like transporter